MAESPVSALGTSELAYYAVKLIMEGHSIDPVYKEVPEPGYVKPKLIPEEAVPTVRVVNVDKTRALIRSKARNINEKSAGYTASISVLRQLWCNKYSCDWWALNLDECTIIACFALEVAGERAERIALLAIAQVLNTYDNQNDTLYNILLHRARHSATIAKLLGKKR
jgi:hypothetical protein